LVTIDTFGIRGYALISWMPFFSMPSTSNDIPEPSQCSCPIGHNQQ
jgi:hypothetical protein